MFPADYPITPVEIKALEAYIRRLQEDAFYQEERNSKFTEQVILDTTRQLLNYFCSKVKATGITIEFSDRHINVNYLLAQAKEDFGAKILLHDEKDIMLFLTDLYSKSLAKNSRHPILNKTLSEMTGYELYKLATYILQDSQSK